MATGTNSSLNAGGSVQMPGLSGSNTEFQIGVNLAGAACRPAGVDRAAPVIIEYSDDVTAIISPAVTMVRRQP